MRMRLKTLEGRSLIAAMCFGQLGSLLPHVAVPSILAGFLIPEWHLSGAEAGLLAGAYAAGYMVAVPVLATLTDRMDARLVLIAGSALSAFATFLFGFFAQGLWSGALLWSMAGVGFAGGLLPRGDIVHGKFFPRRGLFISRVAARRRKPGMASGIFCHRIWPAPHDRSVFLAAPGQAKTRTRTLA
jgi:MFS family permease